MSDLQSQIDDLKRRVAQLEFHKGHLLDIVRQEPTASWSLMILNLNLTPEQEVGIQGVLEATHQAIELGVIVTGQNFMDLLEPFRPSSRSRDSFVKSVLTADDYRYDKVFDAVSRDFNVRMEHLPSHRPSNNR